MKIYSNPDFSVLYQQSLYDLMNFPEYETSPRGLKIKENTNVALILENPLSCLYSTETRSSQKKYIAAELLWYFMGRNDVDFIEKYAKFWKSIQNPDGTVNSSYGHLLFTRKTDYGKTQYDWALTSLLNDLDSRQAVLHFNLPEHQYSENKDFVCTMYGIFQVRNNKLNFSVHMRSNDVVWGLPTDIAFFAILQSQMLNHLRVKYPDLEMGTYTHFANSFHIYEHHFEIIEKMLVNDFTREEIPQVKVDLIDTDSRPSGEFSNLFYSHEFSDEVYSDLLLNWINTNIK